MKIYCLILIMAFSALSDASAKTSFPKCDANNGGGTDDPAVAAKMFEGVLKISGARSARLRGKNTKGKDLSLSLSAGRDLQMILTIDKVTNSRAASICQKGGTLVARIDTGYSIYPQADFVLTPMSPTKVHISGHAVDGIFSVSAH